VIHDQEDSIKSKYMNWVKKFLVWKICQHL
jgi:hypothetical protein